MPWPIPTGRCVVAVVAIALTALFAPLGLTAAAALALIVATLIDAWSVREAPRLERAVPRALSLHRATPLVVDVRSGQDRRLLVRQPATAALAVGAPGETWSLDLSRGAGRMTASLIGVRRGDHELPGLASASIGPLGLARVHHAAGLPSALRVYPDLVNAHALITRLRRDLAGHNGRAARGGSGLGTDFESVREYTPDDDIRQLNWRATARMGRPMSNQYRLERDRDLVCLVDCGRLMAAPSGRGALLDVALDAIAVLALAADELGDRCGAIAFDAEVRVDLPARHRAGRRVVDGLLAVEATGTESDFARAFSRVGGARRALVVVFTDLIDEAAARSLIQAVPMLARRHAVLVASARDDGLQARAQASGGTELERAAAIVARSVLDARVRAVAQLRRAGATVLEAPAAQLGAACLRAYLEAKSRVRS